MSESLYIQDPSDLNDDLQYIIREVDDAVSLEDQEREDILRCEVDLMLGLDRVRDSYERMIEYGEILRESDEDLSNERVETSDLEFFGEDDIELGEAVEIVDQEANEYLDRYWGKEAEYWDNQEWDKDIIVDDIVSSLKGDDLPFEVWVYGEPATDENEEYPGREPSIYETTTLASRVNQKLFTKTKETGEEPPEPEPEPETAEDYFRQFLEDYIERHERVAERRNSIRDEIDETRNQIQETGEKIDNI